MTADPLLPRPPGGLGTGAALALAVHGVLLAALAWSVNWHARTPEVYSAELWSSLPQVAAPRGVEAPPPTPAPVTPVAEPPSPATPPPKPAPEPPAPKAEPPPAPPAPDPQIAIEKAKAEKARRDAKATALAEAEKQAQRAKAEAQQAKADAERERNEKQQREATAQREREAQALKAQQAEDARLAKLREDNLRRMRAQIGAPDATGSPGASGQAARDSAPSASYAGKVAKRIRDNIILTADVPGNPVALVELRTGPSGTIIARRLLKSSGNKDWDEAVLRGVERTDSLPRDTDGRVPPTLELSLRPKE